MTIRYAGGRTSEAVILSRTDDTMRVAIKGSDDVAEFISVDGAWMSENREPVEIEFAWQRHGRRKVIAEADCICSGELASRLVDLLLNESPEGRAPAPKPRAASVA
jgi:hypothetical protein